MIIHITPSLQEKKTKKYDAERGDAELITKPNYSARRRSWHVSIQDFNQVDLIVIYENSKGRLEFSLSVGLEPVTRPYGKLNIMRINPIIKLGRTCTKRTPILYLFPS